MKTSPMGTHFLPLLITILPFLLPAGNSDIAADRAALLLLSSAVRGRTRTWNQSELTPCSSWEGVKCFNNRVTEIRLPGDRLSGQIPLNSIGNLTQLRILSLRRNSLSGTLPSDLGNCTELLVLHLQENNFAGEIPATLFRLSNLVRLNLAGNRFSGEIPPEFNNLSTLKTLRMECNFLNGSLPDLKDFKLRDFNVSFNELNGSIPPSLVRFGSEAFLGNSLCGSPLNSCPESPDDGNKLSGGAVAGISIGSVFGFLLIVSILWILWRRYSNRRKERPAEKSPVPAKQTEIEFGGSKHIIVRENSRSYAIVRGNSGSGKGYSSTESEKGTVRSEGKNVITIDENEGLVFFGVGVGFRVFGMDELLRASAEVLGKGTFGTTYRAYLNGGTEVVVKRLRDVCVVEREFREKVESLGVLDHENLMPIRAYYYGRDEKLLVYDSMPMGSLDALLHGNRGTDRELLTWGVRSRIALGAALGINHLHSLGPNFSHGNIRSSNIFFTSDYHACVSEFGITQLIATVNPHDSRKLSQKADVYSYGVLLLELLTGQKATVDLGGGEGVDLPRWVRSVVKEKWTIDVFDHELLTYQNFEDQMVQLLHLAISCTSQYPEKRPSMVEITKRIKEICRPR